MSAHSSILGNQSIQKPAVSQLSLSQKQRQITWIRIIPLLFIISFLRKEVVCRTLKGNRNLWLLTIVTVILRIIIMILRNFCKYSKEFNRLESNIQVICLPPSPKSIAAQSPAAEQWGCFQNVQLGLMGLAPILQKMSCEELVALQFLS